MEKLKNKKLVYFIICATIIIICLIIYIMANQINEEDLYTVEIDNNQLNNNLISDKNNEEENNYIYIHIIGEVNNPGVVEVKKGSRIIDVIEQAGGVTEMADIERVNLAYQVSDGQKINIPNKNDENKNEIDDNNNYIVTDIDKSVVIENVNEKSKKININTATQSELETINRYRTINSFKNY